LQQVLAEQQAKDNEGEIPERDAAHAKEIAAQVLRVQLPDEQWRRRKKRN